MTLPMPGADALAHSADLARVLAEEVDAAGGWLGFDRFMSSALYAPGLGYYAAGARKFGAAGDFITAPELSPAFAWTLATQVAQILAATAPRIIEVGAGSGRLAADLLLELEARGALPERYAILDLSAELRARQRATIAASAPHLLSRVEWLDALPERFDGLVLGNELLDALPVHLVRWREDDVYECGVINDSGRFAWAERAAAGRLRERALSLAGECAIPAGYRSEIGLAASAWVAAWGDVLGRGVLLLIDYGFPRREYYHPQRAAGTLMCHYRHHAHDDPFFLPGLQDITAHVDFTAVAEAGHAAGLELLGYTTQAAFLLNCGLTDALGRVPADDAVRYLPLANAAHKLISPAEMGELFKVIALGRGVAVPLAGFARGDRSATL